MRQWAAAAAIAMVATVLASCTSEVPTPSVPEAARQEQGNCRGPAGAGDDAKRVDGTVEYNDTDTVIKNVVFAGQHEDDLVRVYGGHVVFINVTFRGEGTSSSGHSLEVKRGGSVEVYNSKWSGSPAEDSVQFADHEDSLIKCSVFASSPGEDHVDVKTSAGAVLDIAGNEFRTAVPGAAVQNKGDGGTQNFIDNKIVNDDVFYELGSGGVIKNNNIGRLEIYGAHDLLARNNNVDLIKQGEWGTGRVPENVTYRDNRVGIFEFNGGSCVASDNLGAANFEACD